MRAYESLDRGRGLEAGLGGCSAGDARGRFDLDERHVKGALDVVAPPGRMEVRRQREIEDASMYARDARVGPRRTQHPGHPIRRQFPAWATFSATCFRGR